MLFNCHHKKIKRAFFILYIIFLAMSMPFAYAVSNQFLPSLSEKKIEVIIKKSHFNESFQISAMPSVVKEINRIRSSKQVCLSMQASLHRMKQYEPTIQATLHKQNMPKELLAIPFIESGYTPYSQRQSLSHAAGIWQMVPQTGRNFGLIINNQRDDRLNTQLSTKAALSYLNNTYKQFNNWMLAVLAYDYGERKIHQLVNTVKTKDVWALAKSSVAPKNLERILAHFDAIVILINNPSLLDK